MTRTHTRTKICLLIICTLILPIIWMNSHQLLRSATVSNITTGSSLESTAYPLLFFDTAICTQGSIQENPQFCSDGAGGMIITWQDRRNGWPDIYAQRINASGAVRWTVNGVAICTASNTQQYPQICSDGAGGAFITWQDSRDGNADIYAQWIDANGVVHWGNGLWICYETQGYAQEYPQICSDGLGGAFIAWQDNRISMVGYDIYMQRLGVSGVKWAIGGILISPMVTDQLYPRLCSDGAGGTIVIWEDRRSGTADIYAQRVNRTGGLKWMADGVAICTAGNTQQYSQICSDGAGGALITWQDHRSGTADIYAQRVDTTGGIKWAANGAAICTAGNTQLYPQLCSDGAGGAIITWEDHRSGSSDIYAQRIGANGIVHWAVDGIAISTAADYQFVPQLCSDRAGGAFITWQDRRSGTDDIYAQWIGANGAAHWAVNGIAICMATNAQVSPQISSDEMGSAFIIWKDARNGNNDIYCSSASLLSISLDSIIIGRDPNVFNPQQLYFKDGNYHNISSDYSEGQKVIVQYCFQFSRCISHFIENITIDLAYNITLGVTYRIIVEHYNVTSAT